MNESPSSSRSKRTLQSRLSFGPHSSSPPSRLIGPYQRTRTTLWICPEEWIIPRILPSVISASQRRYYVLTTESRSQSISKSQNPIVFIPLADVISHCYLKSIDLLTLDCRIDHRWRRATDIAKDPRKENFCQWSAPRELIGVIHVGWVRKGEGETCGAGERRNEWVVVHAAACLMLSNVTTTSKLTHAVGWDLRSPVVVGLEQEVTEPRYQAR